MFRLMFLIALVFQVPALRADPVLPLARSGFETLPEALQQDLLTQPERFLETLAELIIGHGAGGAIDAAGVETAIALERARTRAFHVVKPLRADLDGNGAVSMVELAAFQYVSSARQRGLLEVAHRGADADGDGTAQRMEIAAYAEAKALRAFSKRRAEEWRAILRLDLDSDGRVKLDEAVHAIAAFRGEPA